MNENIKQEPLKHHLQRVDTAIMQNDSVEVAGIITRITGMKIEAVGLAVSIGTICKIMIDETTEVKAEVIGFADAVTFLMATEHIQGIKQGTLVVPLPNTWGAKVGAALLGRILDAAGNPIDGGPAIVSDEYYPLTAKAINPLARKRISSALDVGVRAINALLTIGKGQRMGIFAGTGVGKSVLLGMITRYTTADVVVVGLIGERGREVKEFIEENIGAEGLAKAVVVASPADTSPLMRVNGAALATTIAEYYRDKGQDVLLIVDSLTRYAQSQREIALSAGEMPATKGFSPSVFAKLSQLVERSGNGLEGQGSITAFYTVLVEGDDNSDPIADHARSILDGHIVLSRPLAESGHYPAIDIEYSISRVMPSIVTDAQLHLAQRFKRLYSAYSKNKDLINIGMYQHGADKLIDEAMRHKDNMESFLKQGMNESANMHESLALLNHLLTNAIA